MAMCCSLQPLNMAEGTKPVPRRAEGTGIGFSTIREWVKTLNGIWHVEYDGKWREFRMKVPLPV